MKKLISLLLSLCLLLGCTSAAFAEAPKVYLALGDSITTGYGLAEGEPCFPELLAQSAGYTLINRGVNGNTVAGLLKQLADPSAIPDVMAADLITITCGGNDLIGLLYQSIAMIYNATVPALLAVKAEDIPVIMSDPEDPRQQALMMAVQTILEGNEAMGVPSFTEGDAIQEALTGYLQGLNTVISGIRAVNPDAVIIVATQYNPYPDFAGEFAQMSASVGVGVQKLSQAIALNATMTEGYLVADVYSAFAASEVRLCNATPEPLELDFHPNAAGHAVIAECMKAVLDAMP